MILVILAVCIGIIVVGFLVDEFEASFWLVGLGTIMCFITIIATVILGVSISKAKTIDERLVMYEEENAKIEEQVAAVVTQYQEYETDIFTEVAPDSAMTLVALYPDLKSDTLVQSQITLYTDNNAKIKQLRENKIMVSVKRWWLYFGG